MYCPVCTTNIYCPVCANCPSRHGNCLSGQQRQNITLEGVILLRDTVYNINGEEAELYKQPGLPDVHLPAQDHRDSKRQIWLQRSRNFLPPKLWFSLS